MRTRPGWPLMLCLIAGCSTAPIADTLDFFKPGHLYPDRVPTPYGGVCIRQGPGPTATTPSLPPPQVQIVPPAAPLPPGSPIAVPTLPFAPGTVSPLPNGTPPPNFPIAP